MARVRKDRAYSLTVILTLQYTSAPTRPMQTVSALGLVPPASLSRVASPRSFVQLVPGAGVGHACTSVPNFFQPARALANVFEEELRCIETRVFEFASGQQRRACRR